MKFINSIIFVLVISVKVFSQEPVKLHDGTGNVRWASFEEVDKLSKVIQKPLLISVHTSWCGWCKKMEHTTYKDPQITSYLNTYFYPISLDAETRDTIIFRGKNYTNPNPENKRSVNAIANEIMGQSKSYPTTVLMDHNYENAVVVPGFLTAKDMASFLVFYKEEIYKTENINNFRTDFDNTYSDTKKKNINSEVNFIDLQTAIDINESDSANSKKIFIHFTEANCISCGVMDSISYTNPFVTRYLNANFHNVRFDINSTDTIAYNGQKILPSEDYLFNNFAVSVLKGNMKTPAIAFFNENNKLIMPIQQYLNQRAFEGAIHYIGSGEYMTKPSDEFIKEFDSKIVKGQRSIDEFYEALETSRTQEELIKELLILSEISGIYQD